MTYLIKLKPLSPMFFGSDITFGEGNDEYANSYIVHSRLFPQPTQTVGMLRKLLLNQAGHMLLHRRGEWVNASRRDAAVSLVGSEAASLEGDNVFGKFLGMGPIMLHDGKEFWMHAPADHSFYYIRRPGRVVLANGAIKTSIPSLEGYDPKKETGNLIVSESGSITDLKSVFVPKEQVGIQRDARGRVDENRFFKKTSFVMEKNFSFAFTVELEEGAVLKDDIVFMGAERTSFKLTVIPCDDNPVEKFTFSATPVTRVILLSDAYVDANIYDACEFSLSSKVSMRTIIGKENKSSPMRRFQGKTKKRYTLLRAGSVFYTEKNDTIKHYLDRPSLQRIGLNHYITTGVN
ncbi:MAG: type III-B CRISPR module-associated Cmr3 family protein [Sulfuricurvum sp.]